MSRVLTRTPRPSDMFFGISKWNRVHMGLSWWILSVAVRPTKPKAACFLAAAERHSFLRLSRSLYVCPSLAAADRKPQEAAVSCLGAAWAMQEVTINPSSFPPRRSPAAGFGLGSRRAARHQYALMIGISNEPLDADIRQINKMFLSFLFFVPPAPFLCLMVHGKLLQRLTLHNWLN